MNKQTRESYEANIPQFIESLSSYERVLLRLIIEQAKGE